MKYIVFNTFLVLALLTHSLQAEDTAILNFNKPGVIGQVTRINVNRIDMALENNGNVGLDADTYYPSGTTTSFLFAAGLACSGYVNGDLRTAWMASASRILETQAGKWGMDPADPQAKFYEVSNEDGPGSQAYLDWATAVSLGADFVDLNSDGVYDPNVDRPDLLGDKTIWCVYNDNTGLAARTPRLQTNPLGLEVHQTVWAFNRGDALGDIVFFRYKLINATDTDIDDLIFTNWTDPDLGDSYDDLIACDTTLSMGYIYNFQDDINYGPNPPAFGIDFFQGPVVETGNPLDTALIKRGPFLGVDTLLGWMNLPMTSFMFYIQSDPVIGDPDLAIVARRYQEGGLDKEGNPLDPTAWGTGGTAATNPRYVFSGDPVTGSGWLDAAPDDKRFMVNTGPFQLAAGDTQEIVVAYVVGRSADALSSVNKLKQNDVLAQASYDNNFKAAPPLPNADLAVRTFEDRGEIELVINLADWFAYKNIEDIVGFVQFEGFKIYQFNWQSSEDELNGQENAKLIATFDINNEYGDLYIETDLGPQRVYTALNNIDTSIYTDPRASFLTYSITTDPFNNNNPIVNFKNYYFSVVPFAVNNVLAYPNTITGNNTDWVIPGGPLELTKQSGFFVTSPSAATNHPYYDLAEGEGIDYTGSRPFHEGTAMVSSIAPAEVTGHEYEVRFIDHGNYWQLIDITEDIVKIDSFAFQGVTGTEPNYPVIDGISVKVINVPDHLDTAVTVTAETDSVWLDGRVASGFSANAVFNNGIDMVKNIQDLPDFRNINLNSQITREEYFPVKLVFSTTNSSKGYFWNRATPLFLNNFYGGLADICLEAFDVTDADNPRKLNIVYNALNGELAFVPANRNLIFIMTTDYDENDLYAPTNPNGSNFREDAYLALNLELIAGATLQGGLQTVSVKSYYPNSELDIFRFSSQRLVGELTLDQQKSEMDRIKVVPNPYFAYSSYETSYDAPILKFTHLGQDVTVRIFNLAGQLVRTLHKNDASNEMTWNLRNENDLRVASGMYIAHIEVKGVGEKIIKFGIIQREERLDRF